MCGIVGIYLKSKKFEKSLGGMLSKMLVSMESRGPDSAGFAIYNSDKNKIYKSPNTKMGSCILSVEAHTKSNKKQKNGPGKTRGRRHETLCVGLG